MTTGLSVKQARYHARRAAVKEYKHYMNDPHSPGKASMREDGAQLSAKLAFTHSLRTWGYSTDDTPGWDDELFATVFNGHCLYEQPGA